MRRRWIYTGVCLAALAGVYITWWRKEPPAGLPAAFASILITALFAMLGILFIPRWIEAWSGGRESAVRAPKERTFLKIFLMLLLSRFVILAVSMGFRYLVDGWEGGFETSFCSVWTYGDSYHYIDIAERWYQSTGTIHEVVRLVFLPFYPILMRLLSFVIGDAFVSGLVVSQLSFSVAGYVLYRLARLDMSHEDAMRAVKYLVLTPSAFFYAAPMSDSLFLLLSLSCIYFARLKKYPLACVFGAFAAFTRSLGMTLLAPVCFELIADIIRAKKSGKRAGKAALNLLSLLIIPLGFAAYLYINYRVSGNPFQYAIYQEQHWSQKLGFFFGSAATQMRYAISSLRSGDLYLLFGLWLPNMIFRTSSLVIMSVGVKRLRPSYTAYFIAYFCVALGTTWLLSAPRYLASLFPLTLALSGITKNKTADFVLTSVFIVGSLLYLWAFTCCWQVF